MQNGPNPLMDDLERILITEDQLQKRLDELAAEITRDYRGRELVIVGVLKGCMMFMADLSRRLPIRHSFDMVGAASYGASTKSSGQVRISKVLDVEITGKHVLVAEDIYDSGLTLCAVLDLLRVHRPASLEVCTLLWKDRPARAEDLPIRYIGFRIPDEFVVGYGLDYREIYRNLNCIGVLKPAIYGGAPAS